MNKNYICGRWDWSSFELITAKLVKLIECVVACHLELSYYYCLYYSSLLFLPRVEGFCGEFKVQVQGQVEVQRKI